MALNISRISYLLLTILNSLFLLAMALTISNFVEVEYFLFILYPICLIAFIVLYRIFILIYVHY